MVQKYCLQMTKKLFANIAKDHHSNNLQMVLVNVTMVDVHMVKVNIVDLNIVNFIMVNVNIVDLNLVDVNMVDVNMVVVNMIGNMVDVQLGGYRHGLFHNR